MLRNKIIIIKFLFLLCTIAIGPLSLKLEQVKEYFAFIFLFVILFFAILLALLQKCPNCKKMVGNRYAIMNGEEKFFFLFPKKCPYCGQSFVKEKKEKET
ncbi:MAG: hypothetical protein KBT02_09485 [Treponema sp.]|nr:hypothetical protein [Candidatus Treponema caballi]